MTIVQPFGDVDISQSNQPLAISRDFIMLAVNQAMCDFLGKPAEEVIGRCWLDYIPSSQIDVARQRVRNVQERNQFEEVIEYQIERGDGTLAKAYVMSWPVMHCGAPAMLTTVVDTMQFHDSIGRAAVENRKLEELILERTKRVEELNEELVQRLAELEAREDALRQAAHTSDSLFNLAPIGMIVTRNKAIETVNRALLKILGYDSPDELEGRMIWEIIHPDWRGIANKRANESGEFTWDQPEKRIYLRKDGSEVTVETVGTYINMGSDLYGIVIVQDLTDRLRSEAIIREKDERNQLLMSVLPEGLFLLKDNKITFANQAMADMLGYASPAELVGVVPLSFTHESFHKEIVRRSIHPTIYSANSKVERIYVRRDGTQFPVEVYGQGLKEGDESLILAVVRDITDRQEAERALRESEERWHFALEGGRLGVWDWDIENDTATFSPMWTRMLGYEPSEVDFGDLETWRSRVHPDDRESAWGKQLAHMEGKTEHYEAEFRMKHKDGHWVWISSRGMVTRRDSSGKALRIVGTHTDISDRKKNEERIEQLHQALAKRASQLEVANQELESFSYSVSHDLRSPLRSIDGFASALAADYGNVLDADGLDYLNRVRAAAQRMGDLIDSMLALARLSRRDMNVVSVDLSELVRSISEEIKLRARDRSIEFRIMPGLRARGDEGLLRIVIQNLLENAVKFTREVEHAVIEFGMGPCPFQDNPSAKCYYVSDNGSGFDMEKHDRLFVPFEQLHDHGKYEGHGIGLATVKRIIARHGGSIWGRSEPGSGATFCFTLDLD